MCGYRRKWEQKIPREVWPANWHPNSAQMLTAGGSSPAGIRPLTCLIVVLARRQSPIEIIPSSSAGTTTKAKRLQPGQSRSASFGT